MSIEIRRHSSLPSAFRNGPGGRSCTRTGSVLSGVSLLLDYAGGCGTGLAMTSSLVIRISAKRLVLPVGFAPTTCRFEAGRSGSAELRERKKVRGER